jgi:hypothetical protein
VTQKEVKSSCKIRNLLGLAALCGSIINSDGSFPASFGGGISVHKHCWLEGVEC